MASGEGGARNIPRTGALCLEELHRGGVEDSGDGGHSADERCDDIAEAGADHDVPVRGEDMFGAGLDILVQEDAEEEVLIKGEP